MPAMPILKRSVAFVLVFIVTLQLFSTVTVSAGSAAPDSVPEHYARQIEHFEGRYLYAEYINERQGLPKPDVLYFVEFDDILVPEYGYISFEVEVATAGLYNIAITYFNQPGRSSDMQRSLFINDEIPFFEASTLTFLRTWRNETDTFQVDNQGNEIRPNQVEEHMWHTHVLNSPENGYSQPLFFHLEAGVNRISFVSIREPKLVRDVTIFQAPVPVPYADVSKQGLSPATGEIISIAGQLANRRSSPSLFPIADRSSPAPQPYSPRHILLNSIGGQGWSTPGQWIEWDFYVENPGLYNIALSINQNIIQDAHVYRSITINGQHPFAEMQAVSFPYSNTWRVDTLGRRDTPFEFFLPAGHHTIRMEATLGSYSQYLRDIQESVLRISAFYRQIVMITGPAPDNQRDYQIGRRLPHLEAGLIAERVELDRIHAGLSAISDGINVQRDSVIRTMSTQLSAIYANVDNTPRHLSRLQNSIGALGTWMMDVRNQPLQVDYIFVMPAGESAPRINNGIFRRIWHEISTLFFSFFIDYSAIGDISEGGEVRTITVWTGTAGFPLTGAGTTLAGSGIGRDQANVIRSLIDSDFTPNTGISVNLMLVDMSTLLPATLAGQGPDVALMVEANIPMDFAMRGAVADLSGFPGFDEVAARFNPQGMMPYRFRDYAFALPVTQTFPMLFYRRDILNELEIEPPDTWDDVRTILSVLNENHMTFGLPVGTMDTTPATFGLFLYQAGGRFYADDGLYSELDSDISVSAFRDFTRFFTDYRLPEQYDFANRFRMGEMPVAVADFRMYNLLQVFAPEISGLWSFRKVPGTVRPDGSIDYSSIIGGTAVAMMERSSDKDAAWQFMEWFTSAQAQTNFGRAIESLMGAAARFPTANEEAFMQLPWGIQEFNRLMEQYEYIVGIPQVPGGYLANRQIHNAFFRVLHGGRIGPREALTDNVRYINDEIRRKRREFGLDY